MSALWSNLPEELRVLKNWCLWKLEYPNGPDQKPTKRPYSITGKLASVNDPSTWGTFQDCFNYFSLGGYSGIGFVFTDTDYSGIDLDDPSFLADGLPNPNYTNDLNRQIKIAHEFDSYSEISPSGKGLHIIVRGKVPDGKRTNYIELYPSGRYFTMTGQVHNNKPIGEYQELLTSLWTQMGGILNPAISIVDGEQTVSDQEILELAHKHNTVTFEPLEAAQWHGLYPTQSEADQAYLNVIAYYTNSRIQVERIFRASKLMRSKVDTNKGYLSRSIAKAFDQKLPPINFEGMKEALVNKLAAPSPVKASVFDADIIGSNPIAASNLELPPGLLGEIANFVYAVAPRPVPEVALAAAIGLMAGITGRAYNISGTGLNQYVLLLAMTGAGKEAMAEGIDKLVMKVREQVPTVTGFIGPSEISSGSALFKYLGNTSQSFVSLIGEFGLKLRSLSAPNANGAEVSLRRMILDLYNKSGHNRMLAASAYSKKEDSTSSVPSPSFSILGESTPERFYEVLNEDMISEGLLPRFLLIEYKGGRPPNNENRVNIAPTIFLIGKLSSLAAHCESINHSSPRRAINVQQDEKAAKFLYDFDKLADSKINGSNKDVIRQLWNRAHIKVLKLAALVAVGENMLEPIINLVAAQWAANIVKSDIATLTKRFEDGDIGGNSFELKQSKELIRVIRDYVVSPYEKIEKYLQFKSPQMHVDKVVPYIYLNKRLAPNGAFKDDKGGGTVALKRAIQNLVDSDRIKEVGKMWVNEKYGTSQRCFVLADLSLIEPE